MNSLNSIILEGIVTNNCFHNGVVGLELYYKYNNKAYKVNTVFKGTEVQKAGTVSLGSKIRIVGSLLGKEIKGDHIDILEIGNNRRYTNILEV